MKNDDSENKVIDDLQLLRKLRELPTEKMPQRDLWPEIQTSLHGKRRQTQRWLRLGAAASIVFVMGLSVLLYQNQQQVQLLQEQVVQLKQDHAAVVELSQQIHQPEPYLATQAVSQPMWLGDDMELAKRSLLSQLENHYSFSSDASRKALEEHLSEIEQAISGIKAAMQRQPDNSELAKLLRHTYQQQLEFLTRLSHAPAVEQILI